MLLIFINLYEKLRFIIKSEALRIIAYYNYLISCKNK